MSALPSTTTIDDYLSEQLINCINVQTNVIQNLAQYSQHLSLQLIEIKNNVNILANRIITLEQQQFSVQIQPSPSYPLLLFPPAYSLSPAINKPLADLSNTCSFSTTVDEQPSRTVPFAFDPISSNTVTYSDEDGDDEPTISFNPTGLFFPTPFKNTEEDENILFCEHARLYHFDFLTNQLKERGVGEMKILQHRMTTRCRVLMHREQIFTICANHLITPELELTPHHSSNNTYIWSAIDFADGEAKDETFCVLFPTRDIAERFAKIFNQSKENTEDLPSLGRISLNDSDEDEGDLDVIPLGEIEPTAEQIERARKLQLPLTFYLYENKAPCKGCRGCREDSSVNETQSTNRINSSAFFPNSVLSPLMSMSSPWLSDRVDSYPSPPKDQRMIIKAKRSLPSNRAPPPSVLSTYEQTSSRTDDVVATQTNQKKSRNFSGQNRETHSLDTYISEMVENILTGVKQELHKQKQIVTREGENSKSNNPGFSFANCGTTTAFQFSSNTPFSFGNTPKLSFSDLVKQPSPAGVESEERVFPGQGSTLFEETTPEDDEPTIPFERIVDLSLVEVKTGEEDENVLFCERAKLYRFDVLTNQMKERGVGEMKILQHKTTNRCRLLMRREQVLKICANHLITPQLELKPHHSSDNVYVWSAMDFADGEAKHETLCVKFKTRDIAERFLQQFTDAKNAT